MSTETGMKKITIWTRGYRPFIMGGNVHQAIGCEMELQGPFDLGAGFKGYVAVAPNGDMFVAEGETGAIVGSSLQQVREDIKTAKPSVIAQQMEEARRTAKDLHYVGPAEFWRLMGRSDE